MLRLFRGSPEAPRELSPELRRVPPETGSPGDSAHRVQVRKAWILRDTWDVCVCVFVLVDMCPSVCVQVLNDYFYSCANSWWLKTSQLITCFVQFLSIRVLGIFNKH